MSQHTADAEVHMEPSDSHAHRMPDRRTVLRDTAILQIKLLVDGVRDFALIPLSIAAAAISLLRRGEEPSTELYDLLKAGRRSERWINLFSAAERVHGPASDDEHLPFEDIDDMIGGVESSFARAAESRRNVG